MRYARTHSLTGRGFGSNEMSFGLFAVEMSLNAWASCDMPVHTIAIRQIGPDLRVASSVSSDVDCPFAELECFLRFRAWDTSTSRFALRSSSSCLSASPSTTGRVL